METIEILLTDIKPYAKNAKKHPEEQVEMIAESIKQFGWAQPIVIDENSEILIGHGRLAAAKRLKLKTAPCYIMRGLNEAQKRKLRLIDNKSNESEWDIDLLADEIADLDFDGFDIEWGGLDDGYGEDFTLTNSDRSPFRQMTFTVTEEQQNVINQAIAKIKAEDEYLAYKGENTNSNGNALYLVCKQWSKI